MTTPVFVDLRLILLCRPSLTDFLQLHPEARGHLTGDGDVCRFLAAVSREQETAQVRLQLASLLSAYRCPSIADASRGVVVEIAGARSVDVIAAYSDGAMAWFEGDRKRLVEGTLTSGHLGLKDALFRAVAAADQALGASKAQLPPIPAPGTMVISRITPEGIAFGAGPSRDLASDRIAGPILHRALQIADLLRA